MSQGEKEKVSEEVKEEDLEGSLLQGRYILVYMLVEKGHGASRKRSCQLTEVCMTFNVDCYINQDSQSNNRQSLPLYIQGSMRSHPRKEVSFLSPLIQMLISSKNAFTDTQT